MRLSDGRVSRVPSAQVSRPPALPKGSSTLLVEKPKASFLPFSTGDLPLFLCQELEWLYFLWATRNSAQVLLPLQEPGVPSILDTPQRATLALGFLPADKVELK